MNNKIILSLMLLVMIFFVNSLTPIPIINVPRNTTTLTGVVYYISGGLAFNISNIAITCSLGYYSYFNGTGFECSPDTTGTATLTWIVFNSSGLIGGNISDYGSVSLNETYINLLWNDTNYVNSLLITNIFTSSSINPITGTPSGFDELNTYDGISYNLSEVDSDIELIVNFSGITSFNQIIVRYKSISAESHTVDIALWDSSISDWESYRTVGVSPYYNIMTMNVYDAADHIVDGIVQVRFYSNNVGGLTHKHEFDWVAISDGPATPSSSETDPIWTAASVNYNTISLDWTNDSLSWSAIADTNSRVLNDTLSNYMQNDTTYEAISLRVLNGTIPTHNQGLNTTDTVQFDYINTLGLTATTPPSDYIVSFQTDRIDMFCIPTSNYVLHINPSNFTYNDGNVCTDNNGLCAGSERVLNTTLSDYALNSVVSSKVSNGTKVCYDSGCTTYTCKNSSNALIISSGVYGFGC